MPPTEFTFHCDDCLKVLPSLPAESIDLVVTSPPYNLGIKYGKYRDSLSNDEYLSWCLTWIDELARVLKPDGSLFLNIGSAPANPLLPYELIVRLKQSLFVLQNTFHWIKSITVETRAGETISAGHFKPIRGHRFVTDCHEFVFHLTKTGSVPLDRLAIGVPYTDKSNIARWNHTGGRDRRCRGNTWFVPYKTIVSRSRERPHPATFPVELAVRCIRLHGCRPDLVMLDPFVGIGHSAVAAKECEIGRFIGIDIDSAYLEIARAAVLQSTPARKTTPAKPASPANGELLLHFDTTPTHPPDPETQNGKTSTPS